MFLRYSIFQEICCNAKNKNNNTYKNTIENMIPFICPLTLALHALRLGYTYQQYFSFFPSKIDTPAIKITKYKLVVHNPSQTSIHQNYAYQICTIVFINFCQNVKKNIFFSLYNLINAYTNQIQILVFGNILKIIIYKTICTISLKFTNTWYTKKCFSNQIMLKKASQAEIVSQIREVNVTQKTLHCQLVNLISTKLKINPEYPCCKNNVSQLRSSQIQKIIYLIVMKK
eukprot:TRINITY_DN2999_c1_g4_i1.p2 TRINITY_DN2999_c1_g4~~TRINITY_DN2999_c1_g4_i1.p2  ORF type:complete len:229 (+),score=-15.30 TRINITY_DN2999_c1_g4_i1:1271-1957(+)